MTHYTFIPRSLVLFLSLVSICISAPAAVRDGVIDPNYNVIPVSFALGSSINRFVILPDGKILVTGGFSAVSGGVSNGIARLHSDGSFDPSFVGKTAGGVKFAHSLADGKILISGDFQQYDGAARNRIARINADGSIDPTFAPNLGTEYIEVIAVQPDGKFLVTGNFTSIGGAPRNRVARLNPDGSTDLGFDVGTGFDTTVIYKVAVLSDGKIAIAGKFNSFNGATRRGLLRLNSDGSLDNTFATNVTGDYHEYFDLSPTSDGKLYVVGDTLNGSQIFRFTDTGLIDTTFNTGTMNTSTTGRIYSVVAQPDGKVMMGGDFGVVRINGVNRTAPGLFRFNGDGSVDTGFTAQSPGRIVALTMYGNDKVLVGGTHQELNGVRRGGIGRLDLDSTLDETFVAFLGSPTIANGFRFLPDGKMFVFGSFEMVGTSPASNVARLSANGSVDPTFQADTRVAHRVNTLAIQPDGKIVLGGYAGSGNVGTGLWRLNPDGSLDETFSARIPPFEGVSSIKLLADGKMLVAGGFAQVNGITRRALARLNANGSLDQTFTPSVGGLSLSEVVVQPDGKILIGGSFNTINGSPITNFARLNADGTTDTGFNIGAGANNFVNAITLLPEGGIYVGGMFSSIAGASRARVARLNSDGTIDTKFKGVNLSFSSVNTVCLLPSGKLLIGGNMSLIADGAPRQRILRLLENGSVDYSFDVSSVTRNSSPGDVFQLGRHSDGSFFAAGNFDSISGIRRSGFARLLSFPNPTLPYVDFDGDGRTDVSLFRPSTNQWHALYSFFGGHRVTQWGISTDKLTPADFDGDFRTDYAVFRPSNGTWYTINSSDMTATVRVFGTDGDVPVPVDYDGDEKADLAIYRPSDKTWWLNRTTDGLTAIQFGSAGDLPMPADYDGDRRADVAVFRPSDGTWWLNRSTAGVIVAQFGDASDKQVPGDYTGDGKADVAFWRPSTGDWFVLRSEDFSFFAFPFGTSGDIPAPGDYDGDGKFDATVFRPSNATWYSQRSTAGIVIQQFGANGDRPVANAYVP